MLTSKCASRHNGVHFFDISTSKSGPRMVCFVHFDLEMCFAPQRRALFRHLNFQKWSDAGVFCAFWLRNVLRATTACTFSTSQLPKVVREWCVLYILTSKCASRHNGVHFFISHLASWLRTRRFSEPTFRPSGAPNHWKNTVFRDFPTFSHICIFFLLTLSLLIFFLLIFLFSLPLPCSAFHLSILSEVWLLNFLRLYIILLYRPWLFHLMTPRGDGPKPDLDDEPPQIAAVPIPSSLPRFRLPGRFQCVCSSTQRPWGFWQLCHMLCQSVYRCWWVIGNLGSCTKLPGCWRELFDISHKNCRDNTIAAKIWWDGKTVSFCDRAHFGYLCR